MDRLLCMQVFVRVVEHGAFARAADALGISRTSATTAVAELERRLGVRLLHRTTRRLSLTTEGQAYYNTCVRIIGEIAEAEDSLSGALVVPRGRLRVSVPQSFMNDMFFPALARFIERYPSLETEVVLTDRAVNLVEEGIDCAIRGVEVPPDAQLVAKVLSPARWLTCASPDYLARHGRPQTIEALQQHSCVRFISQSTGRARDWLFRVNGEIQAVVPRGNLRLNSLDAAKQLAISGAGIVQIPDALGYDAVLDDRLEPLLTDHAAMAPSLLVIYPGNRYLSAKVRAFADFFLDVFPKEGWWPIIAAHRLKASRTPARSAAAAGAGSSHSSNTNQ